MCQPPLVAGLTDRCRKTFANRSADRGLSGFNIRHRFTYSWNYQLPFGKGKAHLNDNAVANAILGGWQMNGIATLQTGLPFTPTLASSTTDSGQPAKSSGERQD